MSFCQHLRALSKSLVSLNSLAPVPCNGEYELSVGDQGQLSRCHPRAGSSSELLWALLLQEQCHPHLRNSAGEYFKSYLGLEISHDLVQIGSLRFFMCSWVLAGTGVQERRELRKKRKGSTDCNKLTLKCLCFQSVLGCNGWMNGQYFK